VRCAEGCSISCDPAASCQLQCGNGPSVAVPGSASCPGA
jgi:hypothetical protein